jgi:phosphoserine phosphatase RsbU/P
MLLPSKLPQIPGAQIAGAWQPAREVGGDYFDVIQLDEKRIGICVGDVAGKGITAALLMANLQASFRAFATAEASPQVVCIELNKFLCANTAPGKFVTFFYAVFDGDVHTLTYENAGHSPGLLARSNGTTESLRAGGAVLGALPDWTYQDHAAQLQPGDKLLLSTDGITEAESAQLEEFGEERLLEIARARDGSALDIQRVIMQQVTTYWGGSFGMTRPCSCCESPKPATAPRCERTPWTINECSCDITPAIMVQRYPQILRSGVVPCRHRLTVRDTV